MSGWTPEPWVADLERWKNIHTAFVDGAGEREFVAFYAKKPDARRIADRSRILLNHPDPEAAVRALVEIARDVLVGGMHDGTRPKLRAALEQFEEKQ